MKFALALASAFVIGNASSLQAEEGYPTDPYANFGYYDYPGYQAPSYSEPYGEVLPGADFNRQVYEFNHDAEIWDQNDYEERVKVEAEMLVALEALKEQVHHIEHGLEEIESMNLGQHGCSNANLDSILATCADSHSSMQHTVELIDHLFGECAYADHELHENKDVLILYCQQFAFAPEMVAPCANLLTCNQRELYYEYGFPGSYHVDHHDVHYDAHAYDLHDSHHDVDYDGHADHHYVDPDYDNTHGVYLPEVGGNVYVADPYTDPELAAAAITPYEALIQVDGETYVAPLDTINPDLVELACNDDGCALIPDDGNPYNDIEVGGTSNIPMFTTYG